jgi:hypothetical protein
MKLRAALLEQRRHLRTTQREVVRVHPEHVTPKMFAELQGIVARMTASTVEMLDVYMAILDRLEDLQDELNRAGERQHGR